MDSAIVLEIYLFVLLQLLVGLGFDFWLFKPNKVFIWFWLIVSISLIPAIPSLSPLAFSVLVLRLDVGFPMLVMGFCIHQGRVIASEDWNRLMHSLNGNIKGFFIAVLIFALLTIPLAIFEISFGRSFSSFKEEVSQSGPFKKAHTVYCTVMNSRFALIFGVVFWVISPILWVVTSTTTILVLFWQTLLGSYFDTPEVKQEKARKRRTRLNRVATVTSPADLPIFRSAQEIEADRDGDFSDIDINANQGIPNQALQALEGRRVFEPEN